MSPRLCGGFFRILGGDRLISRASLWSTIFNIRFAASETRFEMA
jgi:hypothetical protein